MKGVIDAEDGLALTTLIEKMFQDNFKALTPNRRF